VKRGRGASTRQAAGHSDALIPDMYSLAAFHIQQCVTTIDACKPVVNNPSHTPVLLGGYALPLTCSSAISMSLLRLAGSQVNTTDTSPRESPET
jgi:hypothetical protein